MRRTPLLPALLLVFLLLLLPLRARASDCPTGYTYVGTDDGADFCCKDDDDKDCDWASNLKRKVPRFTSPAVIHGGGGAPKDSCDRGPCVSYGDCFDDKSGQCCDELTKHCKSVFEHFEAEFEVCDSFGSEKEDCRSLVRGRCKTMRTTARMKACMARVTGEYWAAAEIKADADAAAKKAALEKSKKKIKKVKRKRKVKVAAKEVEVEEETVVKADAVAAPADPFPAALETLFPGDGERVPRAIVEFLAQDKAAKDELVAAAAGTNKDAVKAKWLDAAVKKAGEHLADPAKDAAFAGHLAARSVTEADLAGFYCPRRPAPTVGAADPAMDQLKTANAMGAGAVGAGTDEAAKGKAALTPADTLEAKCGGAKRDAALASEKFTLTKGLVLKEPPPAAGAGGAGGEEKSDGKGAKTKKGALDIVAGGLMGAAGGAALGIALIPVLGPWGILAGALIGAVVGLIAAIFG